MLNIDNFVIIGAKLLLLDDYQNLEPDAAFLMMLWNHKSAVGKTLYDSYPEFANTYQLMLNSDEQVLAGIVPDLNLEFDSLIKLFENGMPCSNDLNYKVLLSAEGAFLSRNDDEETRAMFFNILENDEREIIGAAPVFLTCIMLWFTNHNGYQAAIHEKLSDEAFLIQFKYLGKHLKIGNNYWNVIKALDKGAKLLFLSDEILAFESFNEGGESSGYSLSTLRKIISDESNPESYICKYLLVDSEIARRILPTQLLDCPINGGPATDKLFPLSIGEAQSLGIEDKKARWYNLPEKSYWYLSSIDFSPFDWWWLRTPAADGDPSYVKHDGQIVADVGCSAHNSYGVRPAFWADNSDGYFDKLFVPYEQYEHDIEDKWAIEQERVQEFSKIMEQVGNTHINLGTKIKDLSSLISQKQSKPSQVAASTNTSNNSSGGCYVATAVYGSYDCPQVWTLRRYRDNTLAKTRRGRAFIRLYYAVSPTVVRIFGNATWFRAIIAPRIDCLVQKLQKEGFASTPYTDQPW